MEIKTYTELLIWLIQSHGLADEQLDEHTIEGLRKEQRHEEARYLKETRRGREEYLPGDMVDKDKEKLTIEIINLLELRIRRAPWGKMVKDGFQLKIEDFYKRMVKFNQIIKNLTDLLELDKKADDHYSIGIELDSELKSAGKSRDDFNEMLEILGKASRLYWHPDQNREGAPMTAINSAIVEVANMLPATMPRLRKAKFIQKCLQQGSIEKSEGAINQVIRDHER